MLLGLEGCGAFCGRFWFQLSWDIHPRYLEENIATKELLSIVIAAAIWGPMWRGKVVLCRCDNQAVVKVLSNRCCRDQKLMHLLRCLFFFEAHFQFHMISSHIRSSSNDLADDLSRNNLLSFLQKSGTQAPASPIPRELLDMLIVIRPEWTSQRWRQMFRDTLNKVCQSQP